MVVVVGVDEHAVHVGHHCFGILHGDSDSGVARVVLCIGYSVVYTVQAADGQKEFEILAFACTQQCSCSARCDCDVPAIEVHVWLYCQKRYIAPARRESPLRTHSSQPQTDFYYCKASQEQAVSTALSSRKKIHMDECGCLVCYNNRRPWISPARR